MLALPSPTPLASAGNDVLEGFVCDCSPAWLETGNGLNLDCKVTSSSSPCPEPADVLV